MIIIKGQVPSKSNSYRIGHNKLYKSVQLKEYEVMFEWQLWKHKGDKPISEPFEIWIDVYFQSNRSDLDNAAKVILDCLQKNQIIENDRLCSVLVMRKYIDKLDPRIEIELKCPLKN